MDSYSIPPKPKLHQLAIQVRHHDLFARTVPIELSLSYPVPDLSGAAPLLYFFHYWEFHQPERSITRPLSRIVVQPDADLEDFTLVSYAFPEGETVLFSDLPHPDQTLPAPITVEERGTLEAALYRACENLITAESDEDFTEAADTYVTTLHRLSWPGLLPFYRALNPALAQHIDL